VEEVIMSAGTSPSPTPSAYEIAKQHKLWLETKGTEGRRAGFAGLNLWGVKLHSLISTRDFTLADFSKAQLFEADLRGCNLQFADFRDSTGLSSEMLAGADLCGAELPDLLSWSGDLDLLSSKATIAQSIFLSMVIAAIYIALAVVDTDDLALITNSTTLSLPILNIAVPVIPFYVAAPIVLCTLFFYFCFLQHETITFLSHLPAVMPDGSLPGSKTFSWLPLDDGTMPAYCRSHRQLLRNAISAAIAYGTVPLSLLCIWERGLVARDTKLTALHVVLFAAAISYCLYLFYFPARSVRAQGSPKWATALTASAIFALAYLSAAVLRGGPFPSSFLGAVSHDRRNYDESTYYHYDLGVKEDKEHAWAIPGRLLLQLFHLDLYPDLKVARSPVESSNSEETGTGVAFPYGWEQHYLRGQNIHLESVDMVNCDLRGADFRSAVLSRARLKDCDLTGATLSRAKIRKADLSGTILNDAVLISADLSGTDLQYANLKRAIVRSDLSEAALNYAQMQEVDLSEADLSSAHLDNARLDHATIKSSALEHATFRLAELPGASLTSSDLTESDFERANLAGTDLRCTDISGAKFVEANLSNADLRGMMNRSGHPGFYEPVDFSVRSIDGANLHGANLEFAFGLTAKQIKTARNWKEAFYSADMLHQLKLPASHNEHLEVLLSRETLCDLK
jgi:uncharacterized protein YjbI with pentapeptide repeats